MTSFLQQGHTSESFLNSSIKWGPGMKTYMSIEVIFIQTTTKDLAHNSSTWESLQALNHPGPITSISCLFFSATNENREKLIAEVRFSCVSLCSMWTVDLALLVWFFWFQHPAYRKCIGNIYLINKWVTRQEGKITMRTKTKKNNLGTSGLESVSELSPSSLKHVISWKVSIQHRNLQSAGEYLDRTWWCFLRCWQTN